MKKYTYKEYDKVYNANHYKQHKEAILTYSRKRVRTIKGQFTTSKSHAKRHKKEWNLTIEEYTQFRQLQCYYCNEALPATGVGLDRINNSKGYVYDNVLPCCTRCNRTRGDSWSVEETKAMIAVGLESRKKKYEIDRE